MPEVFHLLERVGVELEYMIADAGRLAIRPIADELLRTAGNTTSYISDVQRGPITWSNELVSHVIELKCTEPVSPHVLHLLKGQFAENILHANTILRTHNAQLMPTAMHPWMQPATETHLWPHEGAEIYQAFDRLFNCRRHGWANLQSMHLNLSFSGDEEFARLHAAVRFLLPILPALAASSPVMDGRITGTIDNRLEVYRTNTEATPVLSGRLIPEAVFSEQEYRHSILGPIAEELKRLDPAGILQPEYSNSRGAIARFERGSLEIRLLDMQECPAADLAIAQIVIGVLRALLDETWCSLDEQKAWSIERLEPILLHCIREADGALISDPDYLRALGYKTIEEPVLARDLWRHLIQSAVVSKQMAFASADFSDRYSRNGCLARRIVAAAKSSEHARLLNVYQRLAECLANNTGFA
ncbi:MAG: carboxylate-amine ligase [Candidatus Sumerlaeaceae bacterium]